MATIIQKVDDLHQAEGHQVPADVSRRLMYGPDEVELDLTADHDAELAKLLAPWLAAGRRLRGHGREATRGSGVTAAKRSRAEYAAIRRWAADRGLTYKTGGGSTYYSKSLLEAWDAHKAEEGLTYD